MSDPTSHEGPITVAIANDYEIIVVGLASLIGRDARIEVVELAANCAVETPVDVVLYDSFGHGRADLEDVLAHPLASRVAIYTWAFNDEAIDEGLGGGVNGYLSKALSADDLVDAIVRIATGEVVVSSPPGTGRSPSQRPFPGKDQGLSEREAEVLALITQGFSNQQAAQALHLSINSIKTHIRSLYRKIDVTDRPAAILYGIDHGFRPSVRSQWWAG